MSDISDNTYENTPEGAAAYLLNWMKKCKEQLRDNPEAFQPGEPGFYIGV
jgi:hypothetical protein